MTLCFLILTYHPKMGGLVITTAAIQTHEIIERANRLERLRLEYANGLVIAKYLSILIAQRERIDAVHKSMSREIQSSQNILPKRHSLSVKKGKTEDAHLKMKD